MTRAVIDVGSNSIRLMVEGNYNKYINTTQLAQGLSINGRLQEEAINRTAIAINEFYHKAFCMGCDVVYVFATEAVRSATNGMDFINTLYKEYGITVDLLSPEREAQAGFTGANIGGQACVIDIGGASTEIIVGKDNDILYSKSLPIGIVRLKDLCGSDTELLNKFISKEIKAYANIPAFDYIMVIGGSASTIVSILIGGFDRDKIHKYKLTTNDINKVIDILINTTDKDQIIGLPKKRAEVILGGILLLDNIMKLLKVNEVIVSEADNMEGYLKLLDDKIK